MYIPEIEFRVFVDNLFQEKREGNDGFLHAAVGLAGESGEVLDHMKKMWVYDRPMDREKVLEEMGDTIHYLMMLCLKMDVTFSDLMLNNIDKLIKRYPNGFTKAAAIARADKNIYSDVGQTADRNTYPEIDDDPLCLDDKTTGSWEETPAILPVPTGLDDEEDARRHLALQFNDLDNWFCPNCEGYYEVPADPADEGNYPPHSPICPVCQTSLDKPGARPLRRKRW